MATIWVSTFGDNANDGSTYALAKADLYGATGAIGSAGVGDTINVVADGNYAMNASPITQCYISSEFDGTDWAAGVGLVIRGTTSTGTPAMATFVADATNTEVFSQAAEANYIQYQGLRFDYTAVAALAAAGLNAITLIGNAQNTRVYDCEFIYVNAVGPSAVITNTNLVRPVFFTGASVAHTGTIEVTRCLFMHCSLEMSGNGGQTHDVHHNVFVSDGVNPLLVQYVQAFEAGSTGAPHRMYHNTFITRKYAGVPAPSSVVNAGDDTVRLAHHSNLFYTECGSTVGVAGINGQLMAGHSLATATACITAGYDLLAIGPYAAAFEPDWDTKTEGYNGYQYNHIFRSGVTTWTGTNVDPNSLLALASPYADTFNDTLATYDWEPDTYTHTLLVDWRPRIGRTTGLGGTVPGAIPNSISVLTALPDVYAVTAGNTLEVPAPGVLDNDIITPVDVMFASLVSNVATGSLSLASDGSFEYTPPLTYSGTVSFTYQAYIGTVLSNVTTAVITVDPFPVVDPGTDPEPITDFLDTAPFFRPTLEVTTEFRHKSRKNRTKHQDLSNYTEKVRWEESTHRVLNLATNTTQQVTLGGVASAEYFILETDFPIDVSVNDTSRYWPVDEVVAVALTGVTTVWLRNNSNTNTAQVFMTVVD